MSQHGKIEVTLRDKFFQVGRMLLYNLHKGLSFLEQYEVPTNESKNAR